MSLDDKPDEPADKEAITVTFTRKQIDYLDRIVQSGDALNRPDAVRTVIKRTIEMEG